jgi:hypothetical protein
MKAYQLERLGVRLSSVLRETQALRKDLEKAGLLAIALPEAENALCEVRDRLDGEIGRVRRIGAEEASRNMIADGGA